jgi:hypothetical protein
MAAETLNCEERLSAQPLALSPTPELNTAPVDLRIARAGYQPTSAKAFL